MASTGFWVNLSWFWSTLSQNQLFVPDLFCFEPLSWFQTVWLPDPAWRFPYPLPPYTRQFRHTLCDIILLRKQYPIKFCGAVVVVVCVFIVVVIVVVVVVVVVRNSAVARPVSTSADIWPAILYTNFWRPSFFLYIVGVILWTVWPPAGKISCRS